MKESSIPPGDVLDTLVRSAHKLFFYSGKRANVPHVAFLKHNCFLRQVDMSEASLRPGRELSWLAALRERLLANVSASSAAITAYVGSFLHDIDQARTPPASCDARGHPRLFAVRPVANVCETSAHISSCIEGCCFAARSWSLSGSHG